MVRRQDNPPQFTEIIYELRLVTDEPERRVEVLHRNLRRFGTVYHTLAAAGTIDGRIVAIPSGAPPLTHPIDTARRTATKLSVAAGAATGFPTITVEDT